MCGIVGYIGNESAAKVLFDGLSKLEYRGYDSAGLALHYNEGINVIKCGGRLSGLKEKFESGYAENFAATAGIGHTRWATHGEPNDVNSHPHLSGLEKFAVVHNGIVENFAELKAKLIEKGFQFSSETDTEVIANLLEYYYKGDIVDAISRTANKLEGSYALGVLMKENPDEIFAVRRNSPLIVAYDGKAAYMASDIPALLPYTRDFYEIDTNDVVVLRRDGVTFYDINREKIEKATYHVDWDVDSAALGGYEHFMIKEIHEQPFVLKNTISTKIKNGEVYFDNFSMEKSDIENIDKLFVLACGSAFYAGMVGSRVLEKLTKITAQVELASEFRYQEPVISKKSLVIIISQSGETADSLAALKYAKERGAQTLAIVNVVGSAIAKAADSVIYTNAGPEISVATTKAYSCQLAALYLLSIYVGRKLELIDDAENSRLLSELVELPNKVEKLLSNKEIIQYYASQKFKERDIFFIGRNLDYAAALEGSLKLKEISYIHSEAYAAGELKHGTIALIERDTLVIAVAVTKKMFDKTASNILEVKARGADILAITWENNPKISNICQNVLFVPETEEIFTPSLTIIPLQLFAYYVASAKGLDIDKPRNLAKSVTVE